MGVLNANPFLRWLVDDVLQLVVMGFLPPPQQNAGVGFLLQNADHRTGGVLVNKIVFIFRALPAAVDGAGVYVVSIPPLGQQGAPGFHGYIAGIGGVQQIF